MATDSNSRSRPLLTPSKGATLTWNIAMLDDSLREMSYTVDACECGSAGGYLETLVNVSYSDDGTSPATHPLVPSSIGVDVLDPTQTCGVPSVTLGEKHIETSA